MSDIKVGDRLECELLRGREHTGKFVPVEVREILRDWHTGEPVSVRVKYKRNGTGEDRFIWVQVSMLRAMEGK